MDTFFLDTRFAVRQFFKSPGFTVTAVISLALGMGATTAIFSVIYAVLLNPYPYRAVDRIVRLTAESNAGPGIYLNLNGTQVRQVRQLPLIESVLAMDFHTMALTSQDAPVNVNVAGLISTGFQDLGVPPLLGRGILPSDAAEGQEPQPVAVLSYKFWVDQFFSDPAIIGKTLQLDHKSYVVVGVAAPRFTWYRVDAYLPLKLTADPATLLIVNLRLKPGVSRSEADAALEPLLHQFARDFPRRFPQHFNVRVEGLNDWVARDMGGTLYLLLGAVALLLAIGCGNVSILLLARGTARRHELAMRVALGAHRARVMRQLLTESVLLSAFGVTLGVLLSYGILAGIRLLLPPYAFAPEVVVSINLPVLCFSCAVALATGILFGLWPALQLARVETARMTQPGVRRVAGTVHGRRTHAALIAGQLALTLLLLAAAGSAMEAFLRLMHTRLGYDPHNILALGVPLRDNSYTTWSARAAYFEQLRAKVAESPGVIMTAIATNAIPPHNGFNQPFEILGQTSPERPLGSINPVGQGYFEALRIPLVEGRLWSGVENRNGAHVAVVNRTLARRYFSNGDAVGGSLKLPAMGGRPPAVLTIPRIGETWLEIVGVVADSCNDGLSNPIRPAVYFPFTLDMGMGTQILVKARVPPMNLLRALRLQLTLVDPDQRSFTNVGDLDMYITLSQEWQQEHLSAWIFAVFAGLALVLAAVGLYSVVSYTAAQRTNEFGIRMALGAQRGHVLQIVFRSTALSVAGGILTGLALAMALNRILQQWTRVNSRDPMILLAGALLLFLVSAVACIIPAWHASQADPMTALRFE